jgi:3-oxoacyl-[acyl-carrier protein] reductase
MQNVVETKRAGLSRGPLQGRNALVTGGGRGIGRAIAKELLRAGAHVIIGDIVEQEMEQTCRDLASYGLIDWVTLDVGNHLCLQDGIAELKSKHGGIDVLVNNAGIGKPGLFAETDPKLISKTLSIDLAGAVCLTRSVLPHMIAQRWGRVANISSMMAFTGCPGFAVYSAAKAGILGFSEALEREMRRFGSIRVTAVLPPSVKTSSFEDAKTTEAGLMRWRLVPPISAESVARRTVHGLIAGRRRVYCSVQSVGAALLQRFVPWAMDRVLMYMFRPAARTHAQRSAQLPAHP